MRHSFPAYDPSSGVNMTKDEAMNHFGATDADAFTGDALSFDAYFNDDAMIDAPVARFTPINDATGSMSTLPDTVSPADLLYNDFSAPNSNSFTNLTTPSMLDDNSPFLTDSANVSPAFELGDFNTTGAHHDSFAPLFPSNEFDHLGSATTVQARKQHRDLNSSSESLVRQASTSAMSRSTSARSNTDAPMSSTTKADILRHRLSLNAGIGKSSRRATKALGPIEVDEGDERALKRAKNTLAARKSRQKKKDEVETLESKLLEMVEERDYWKMLAVRYGAPVPEGN